MQFKPAPNAIAELKQRLEEEWSQDPALAVKRQHAYIIVVAQSVLFPKECQLVMFVFFKISLPWQQLLLMIIVNMTNKIVTVFFFPGVPTYPRTYPQIVFNKK